MSRGEALDTENDIHEEALRIEQQGRRMARYALLKTRLHPGYNGWDVPAKSPCFLPLALYSSSNAFPQVVFDAANGSLREHDLSVKDAGGPHADFKYHMIVRRTGSPDSV